MTYASAPGSPDHLASESRNDRAGVKQVGAKYAGYPFIEVGRIPPEVPARLARELKAEHPEIDTIHLGSPHWATAAIIDPLERELGVNIVAGSQALLWWALRQCGINDRIRGFGRLLGEH